MSEQALHGGDVNVVVRVGDSVRRPTGHWSPAVHALLRHFEAAGFDGAPRFLGIDEQGREILSFVEGEPALTPVPGDDKIVYALGALLRRMHDAQTGFEAPPGATWFHGAADAPVICHNDPFPPNVILRGNRPAALIDFDLAGPGEAVDDVAEAAYHWAPLRIDRAREAKGLPENRRGERLRALCEGYGLAAGDRARLLDCALEHRQRGYELHRRLGGLERRPGWRDMWDRGSGRRIRANARWLAENKSELNRFLR